LTVSTPLGGTLGDNKAFVMATQPTTDGSTPNGIEVLEIDLASRTVTSLARVAHVKNGSLAYSGGRIYFNDSDDHANGIIRIIDVATKQEHSVARDWVGPLVGRPDGVYLVTAIDAGHAQLSRLDASDQVTDLGVVGATILELAVTDAALFYSRVLPDATGTIQIASFDPKSKTETILESGEDTTHLASEAGTEHVYYGLRKGTSLEVHDATSSDKAPVSVIDLTGTSLDDGPIVNHDKIVWVELNKRQNSDGTYDDGETLFSLPLAGGTPKLEQDMPHITGNTALFASGSEGDLVGTPVASQGFFALDVKTF
jgi:hypothetical protein